MSGRSIGMVVVAAFAILSGIGEIVVGITGNYFGILTRRLEPSIAIAIVGMFYVLGGLFLLLNTRRAAALAVVCILAEVLGRVYVVVVGVGPTTGADLPKVVAGGLIAVALVAYIIRQWKTLD